jgi:hypothetical protein
MLVIAAGVALVAARAQGAEPDHRAEARRRYERALELVDEGAYAEAVVEFSRAYELAPHHTVLYNLGQAYVALGKPVEAIDALRRFLAEGGAQVAADRRAQVEQEIRRQEARVGTLAVETEPPGAAVQLDGGDVGKTPLPAPVRVGIGVHRVSATLAGRARAEQSVTVAGEEQKVVHLALALVPPPAAAPPASPPDLLAATASPPPEAARRTPATRPWAYAACIAGAAAGAAAIAVYFWNRGRNDTWNTTDQQLAAPGAAADPTFEQRKTDNDALARSIRNASTIDVGLGIASGVLLATGIVMRAAW